MKSKNIINAWNKVNADNTAHHRMLNNIIKKSHSVEKRKKSWKMYASLAAGFVAVVLVALIFPTVRELRQQDQRFNVIIEPPNATDTTEIDDPRLELIPVIPFPSTSFTTPAPSPADDITTIPITPMPSFPPFAIDDINELLPTIPLPSLPSLPSSNIIHVNLIPEPPALSRVFRDGHFWHTLTEDELQAVLPGLGFPVHASANYNGIGTLFTVSAYETLLNGNAAMFEEFFMRTTIEISPNGVPGGPLIYFAGSKQASYIQGLPVIIARSNISGANQNIAMYQATFELDGIYYQIRLHDNQTGSYGQYRLIKIVDTIIQNGAANLYVLANPVIPELRNNQLTLQEAKQDPVFGSFLPANVPPYLSFDYARRVISQDFNGIFAFWYIPLRSEFIRWQVGNATSHDIANVVSINEREKFDLSLYTIPFAESVPTELSQFVMNPVFLAHELTHDAIQSRALDSRGSIQMNFGILFGDVVVYISVTDISPDEVWELIIDIKENLQ